VPSNSGLLLGVNRVKPKLHWVKPSRRSVFDISRFAGTRKSDFNLSDSPLRMVVIASPGGIEEILRLIAKGGDIDIMALSEKIRGSEYRPHAVS
jgi:hypothetical protein